MDHNQSSIIFKPVIIFVKSKRFIYSRCPFIQPAVNFDGRKDIDGVAYKYIYLKFVLKHEVFLFSVCLSQCQSIGNLFLTLFLYNRNNLLSLQLVLWDQCLLPERIISIALSGQWDPSVALHLLILFCNLMFFPTIYHQLLVCICKNIDTAFFTGTTCVIW